MEGTLAVPPKYHQAVVQKKYRNAFDAVSVYKRDVIILALGGDSLHCRYGPYTAYVLAVSILFWCWFCYPRLKCAF